MKKTIHKRREKASKDNCKHFQDNQSLKLLGIFVTRVSRTVIPFSSMSLLLVLPTHPASRNVWCPSCCPFPEHVLCNLLCHFQNRQFTVIMLLVWLYCLAKADPNLLIQSAWATSGFWEKSPDQFGTKGVITSYAGQLTY